MKFSINEAFKAALKIFSHNFFVVFFFVDILSSSHSSVFVINPISYYRFYTSMGLFRRFSISRDT
ncbi:hypothetical protein AGMMS49921_07960 [Endomicrobiia bacterium]|nr:hypothetical protein AGMMS49921_07960 [Endomicrobiia bacterium]